MRRGVEMKDFDLVGLTETQIADADGEDGQHK